MKNQIIKHMNTITPHKMSLDLAKIDVSGNRVNIGIRCEPELKIRLAKKAEAAQVSLSSFAEKLLLYAEGQFDAYAERNKDKYPTLNLISQKASPIEDRRVPDAHTTINYEVINTTVETNSTTGIFWWNSFFNITKSK